MDFSDFVPVITGLGLGGIGVAIVNYLSQRRKVKVDTELAKRTQDAQVAIADISAVQARMATLEKIIDRLEKHSAQQQVDLDAADERERKQRMRIRELEDEIDKIRNTARETQHKCDELSRIVRELSKGTEQENAADAADST